MVRALRWLGVLSSNKPEEWYVTSRKRWRLLSIWIVAITAAIIWSITSTRNLSQSNEDRINDISTLVDANKQRTAEVAELAKANKQRTAEIQASRVKSCETTYGIIRALIVASAKGQKLTKVQQARFQEFLDFADPKKCVAQTKPKTKP